VLLLDEPSLGLAPLVVKQVFEVIERINKAGTTVLLAEQNAYCGAGHRQPRLCDRTRAHRLEGDRESLLNNEAVRKAAYIGV
jgi:branched-chain amino acid transport system ATP-binding protein